ncbi:MAG: hypothetical protein M1380_02085 [Chloroflexi bacterium]|nr:hypothetical protein [Chloroflexota bacterium]
MFDVPSQQDRGTSVGQVAAVAAVADGERLHQLVDWIPEDEIHVAERFLMPPPRITAPIR